MSWIAIGAVVLVALLLLNSAVVIGFRLDRHQNALNLFRDRVTRVGIVLYGFLGIATMVGLATTMWIPKSTLGAWIAEHGLFTYIAFFVAGTTALVVVSHYLGYPTWKRDDAA
jgi:hypothetical protein